MEYISKFRIQGVWDLAHSTRVGITLGCCHHYTRLPPPLHSAITAIPSGCCHFHPDVSHLEFCCRRHSIRMSHIRNSSPPTFHLDGVTSGILLRRHSTQMSHIRNSSPPTFHLGISHLEFFSTDILSGYLTSGILSGRRSTFLGYLASGILSDRRSTFFFILRAFS